MSVFDPEIANMKHQGFALAGMFQSCRVYRGNDQVRVVGTPQQGDEQKQVNLLTEKIKSLDGHKGWQGARSHARNARTLG